MLKLSVISLFFLMILLEVILWGKVLWCFEVIIVLKDEDVVFCFFIKNFSLLDIWSFVKLGWIKVKICLYVVFVIFVVFFNILIFELFFIKCKFLIVCEIGISFVLICLLNNWCCLYVI